MEPVTTLQKGKLTVATYGGFAPSCYKDEHGKLIGLDLEYLKLFAKQLDLEVVPIEKDFDKIWTLPGQDVCDIAGAGILRREDRVVKPGGTWSDPYYSGILRSVLVRGPEQAEFDDYLKLKDKVIVVTRNSSADIDGKHRYPHCKFRYVDEFKEAGGNDVQGYITKLIQAKSSVPCERIDAFGEGTLSNTYLCKVHGSPDHPLALADEHPYYDPKGDTFNFIVRDASTGILEKLNVFIKTHKYICDTTSK